LIHHKVYLAIYRLEMDELALTPRHLGAFDGGHLKSTPQLPIPNASHFADAQHWSALLSDPGDAN
jgi:hypothetical protein